LVSPGSVVEKIKGMGMNGRDAGEENAYTI
jgi:hypothetical protein